MISDLSRYTYKAYGYLIRLFRKQVKDGVEPPSAEEIEEKLTAISEKQKLHRDRLDSLSSQTSELLRSLHGKELDQIRLFKEGNELFLESIGIDRSCVEEFLKEPTSEKLEELKKKYPKK